jgi:hypothetical protein
MHLSSGASLIGRPEQEMRKFKAIESALPAN